MNENLNHQAPAPANGAWNWKNVATVLAIVVASVSATAFIMNEDAKTRNQVVASIEKLNNTIVEFRLEMKDELGDIKIDIAEMKNDIREIKSNIKIIESRLDDHDTRFVELEGEVKEIAESQ